MLARSPGPWGDACDNCAAGANPTQQDLNSDGHGPPCDCDDADDTFHDDAPEINDGLDTQ